MKSVIEIPKERLTAPIDFGKVITEGSAYGVKLGYAEYSFLTSESGRYVMFDAYAASHKYAPFETECPAVAYPFCLTCQSDDGERVAYCGLRMGDDLPAVWKPCFAGEAAKIYGRLAVDGNAAAVPVSSGVCGIASVEAYEKYFAHIKDEMHPLSGFIVLDGQTHTAVDIYGERYAIFSTGWGDGRYKCYVGLDGGGKAVALIVDFGMIEYPSAVSGETVEVEADVDYVYDPSKTEYENRIAQWTEIIETSSDPKERLNAYSRRGYAYHSADDTDSALADYEAAIRECDNVTDRGALARAWSVYDNAAALCSRRGDYSRAIEIMTAAMEVADDFYAGAFVRLIDLYRITKQYDKALAVAEKMYATRRDDPVACMKYAEACAANTDYERAASAYDRLATEFQLFDNYIDKASCLIELGRYDEADAALESYPAKEINELYWYNKACIDYRKREYFTALEHAQLAYELDKTSMPVLLLMIETETLLQSYHTVARHAEDCKKLRPNSEYGHLMCAEAHLIIGNFLESSRNFYKLYVMTDDDKYAALAAMTAAKTGDGNRASTLLKKLRRKHSEYYLGALYAVYSTKRSHGRDVKLSKIVYRLRADDDFLLQLAVFLTNAGSVLPASHILDILIKKGNPPFDVVAQQIRTAVKLQDGKLFDYFLRYYVDNFIGAATPECERDRIKERFLSGAKNTEWTNIS